MFLLFKWKSSNLREQPWTTQTWLPACCSVFVLPSCVQHECRNWPSGPTEDTVVLCPGLTHSPFHNQGYTVSRPLWEVCPPTDPFLSVCFPGRVMAGGLSMFYHPRLLSSTEHDCPRKCMVNRVTTPPYIKPHTPPKYNKSQQWLEVKVTSPRLSRCSEMDGHLSPPPVSRHFCYFRGGSCIYHQWFSICLYSFPALLISASVLSGQFYKWHLELST